MRAVISILEYKSKTNDVKEIFMKKMMTLALTAVLAVSLAACGTDATSPAQADVVSTPSVYTKQYTNLDQPTLLAEIDAYTGVSVIATTNADGTPNNAILTPAACGDDSHIMFEMAPNTTKENLMRDKVAEMVFDIPNTTAETKEERHAGAVVRLELEEDPAVLEELKANNELIRDHMVICKIVELMPLG